MLLPTKRRYKKKYAIGGAGIFDSITNLFKRVTGSTAAKAIASNLSNLSKTEIGKKAIEAGKTVAKEVGFKAIDVGKDLAIAKAKAIIDGYAPAPVREPTQTLTQKSKDMLEALVKTDAPTGSGAISIQDLVKRLNGSGLRLA